MIYLKRILSIILIISLLTFCLSCSSDEVNDDSFEVGSSEENSSFSFSSEENSEESLNESFAEDSSTDNYESSEWEESSNNIDETSEESSEDSSEEKIEDETRFSLVGPPINYNKVWENGKMELYNTDFRMSSELENKFAKQFASFSNAQSVALIELDTDMAFFYSKDQKIGTASAIKGPLALYAYKCIDDGIISWDQVKTYQPWHFQENSTGWVQRSPFGTGFTVKTLMDYMIRISDNQAYLMIKEMVGTENFEKMMANLGSTRIIPVGGNWGDITAFEMAAVWREIYFYSLSGDSGAELFDRFMHAQYNYIWRAIPQYEAAHKSGWSGRAFNDAGVVFADGHQYVLVVLMGRSSIEDGRSEVQFNAVTRLLAELMVEYNAYIEADNSTDSSKESED